jgi:hypothetical protein
LTADSRRDRSSKFGPFGRRVTARRGGPDGQPDTQPKSRAQSGLLADFGGHGANGHFPYESSNQANPEARTNAEGWTSLEARTNGENWASPGSWRNAKGWTSPESETNAEGWTYREGFTSPEDQTNAEGWTYREGFTSPESQTNAEGWTYREGFTSPESQTNAEDGAPHTRDRETGAGGEPTLILNAERRTGRHTGRHAGHQVKTDRKRKLRKVIPAAAVVAVVAAGTAAYGLTSGGSHAMRSNAAATLPGTLDALGASPSSTNTAGTKLVKVATAKATTAARPAVKPTPKPTASSKPSAASSAASAPAEAAVSAPADAASSGTTTSNAPATQAAAPAATPAASQSATATTVSCNLNSGGLLPQNVTAIVNFLLANGYSDNAAAGIAGNMYQESGGNPEAVGDGGGGLIGFTPLPSGYVTGDATANLQTQLNAVLTYNQIWASYIPALNAATSPSDAADIYVTDFERAGIPATATREASAEDVASACGL